MPNIEPPSTVKSMTAFASSYAPRWNSDESSGLEVCIQHAGAWERDIAFTLPPNSEYTTLGFKTNSLHLSNLLGILPTVLLRICFITKFI
jgi:hypothetical protein